MATAKTLKEALSFFLEDDNLIDRLEANALMDLIMQDGKIDREEKQFLVEAIQSTNFDDRALATLQTLVEQYQQREGSRG